MIRTPQRLVVMGSILMDVTVYVDRWPARGGDVLARAGSTVPGGTFNVIAAARRLGLETAYGGLIGQGVFGDRIRQALRELDVTLLASPTGNGREDTGFDVAVVESDGERTFMTVPGWEAHLKPRDLADLHLRVGDAVYVTGYDLLYQESGATLEAFLGTLPDDVMAVLDPGPLAAELPASRLDAALSRLSILTLNAREGALLTAQSDPVRIFAALKARLPDSALVILRLGEAGALVGGGGIRPLKVPARPAIARDTTGAGDVHTAALLAGLARGSPLREAVREANIAASWAVEHEGPSQSPSRLELDRLLADWT